MYSVTGRSDDYLSGLALHRRFATAGSVQPLSSVRDAGGGVLPFVLLFPSPPLLLIVCTPRARP
jgi:hypothetical protein